MNPLHIGHVRHLEAAKKLGDKLLVIINNDLQVKQKGSVPFMPAIERMEIVNALRCVDDVALSIDSDGTQIKTLRYFRPDVFAKGGDRTERNIPEADVCRELGIKMVFGVGGGKIRASSEILKQAREWKG